MADAAATGWLLAVAPARESAWTFVNTITSVAAATIATDEAARPVASTGRLETISLVASNLRLITELVATDFFLGRVSGAVTGRFGDEALAIGGHGLSGSVPDGLFDVCVGTAERVDRGMVGRIPGCLAAVLAEASFAESGNCRPVDNGRRRGASAFAGGGVRVRGPADGGVEWSVRAATRAGRCADGGDGSDAPPFDAGIGAGCECGVLVSRAVVACFAGTRFAGNPVTPEAGPFALA